MNGPDSERREELLALAEELSKRLRAVEIPVLNDPSALSRGMPPSVISHATAYLARVRNSGQFGEFLSHLDQLDTMTAQNLDNPKAHHRVLRQELEAFLADQPNLGAGELLYVLSWVRRLLHGAPEKPVGRRRESGSAGGGPTQGHQRSSSSAPFRGGQLAAALEKARRNNTEDGNRDDQPNGDRSRK